MKFKAERAIFKHFISQLNSVMTEYFFFVCTRYLNNINYEVSQFKIRPEDVFLLKKKTRANALTKRRS